MKTIKNTLIATLALLTSPVRASAPSQRITIDPAYTANTRTLTPQTFQLLKANKECQTDWHNKEKTTSQAYRKLAFEALTNLGHPYPEYVMITNTNQGMGHNHAFVINGIQGQGIEFNETFWNQKPYGVIRMTMYHEATHCVGDLKLGHAYCDHNPQLRDMHHYHEIQKQENECDQSAVLLGQCTECAREFCQSSLDMCCTDQVVKTPDGKQYTLDLLDTLHEDAINKLIKTIARLSANRRAEHPLFFERALRIYLNSKSIGHCLCPHHRQKTHQR